MLTNSDKQAAECFAAEKPSTEHDTAYMDWGYRLYHAAAAAKAQTGKYDGKYVKAYLTAANFYDPE